MTADEYKKKRPEHKDLQGNELTGAIAWYMLREYLAKETIKQNKPIWKTHTLRWLFYRNKLNFVIGNPKTDKYKSDSRCSVCKKGVNYRTIVYFIDIDGKRHIKDNCPHCNKPYISEPNTNLSHKVYKFCRRIKESLFVILDKLHIVRNTTSKSRYESFSDESRYVYAFSLNFDTGETTYKLLPRKWWEYVLIEKPHHNF